MDWNKYWFGTEIAFKKKGKWWMVRNDRCVEPNAFYCLWFEFIFYITKKARGGY